MAYNRNLYSSDTDALDAGIIYDQNELMMQDEVNAAIKNGDLIVGQADNLASKMNQFSTGEFVVRTTGGDASLSDGDGHLVLIRGNMIHTGYIAKSVNMTVTPIERDPSAGEFTAQIDDDLFLAEMEDTSGTMVFTYGSSGWDYDPANYGITTDGLALPGDVISVTYQKEVRGTIIQSDPQTFVSTGWNLYDHSKGYARALYYNDNPRFGITGTYTSVQYSLTITGTKSSVTPDANGTFGIPTDGNGGYIWVNGGNDTDTAVWMCWSDWQTEPNGGVWQAYSETEIDLSTIMATYFVNGLMAVGSYKDEIDLSLGKVTANVGKMTYTEENLDDVIEMGVEYDYDNSYIYYGLTEPIVSQISIENTYAAYDHGIEYFTGTEVPIYAQTLYGINLKNKLERDVVTISQQTLSASEQAQVAANLNVVKKSGDIINGHLQLVDGDFTIKNTAYAVGDSPPGGSARYVTFYDKNTVPISWIRGMLGQSNNTYLTLATERKINGTTQYNLIALDIDSSGNKNVTVSDPTAWRTAIGAVNKAGDSMSGGLTLTNGSLAWVDGFIVKDKEYSASALPPAASDRYLATYEGKDNDPWGYIRAIIDPNNRHGFGMFARNVVNGSTLLNGVSFTVSATGELSVYVTAAKEFRQALALGNAGNFPITIAQGGTGYTGVSTSTTVANIVTAATNVTVTSATFCSWGKLAQFDINFKATADLANGALLGTIVSGKRPVLTCNPFTSAGSRCTLGTTGAINIWANVANNSTVSVRAVYLLP